MCDACMDGDVDEGVFSGFLVEHLLRPLNNFPRICSRARKIMISSSDLIGYKTLLFGFLKMKLKANLKDTPQNFD